MRVACLVVTAIGLCAGCSPTNQPPPSQTPIVTPEDRPADTIESDSDPANGDTPPADSGASAGHAGEDDRIVHAEGIILTAPDDWQRQPPRSSFVIAEFALPKADGDPQDGRLTVSVAGGSIDANIDRWRGQFGGRPERDEQGTIEVDGVKVTMVDLSGTFNDQAGPFAPGETRENYRMLAAIVPGDGQQLHFIKAYGPLKTMAKHEDAFRALVESIERP